MENLTNEFLEELSNLCNKYDTYIFVTQNEELDLALSLFGDKVKYKYTLEGLEYEFNK